MSFQEIATTIGNWVDEGAVPGASILVQHQGRQVAEFYAGEAQSGVPVGPDTMFGFASLSKPITVAMFMTLVDQGLVHLDDPVTDVLVDFGAEVDPLESNAMLESMRDSITFRMILAHTSGLPENVSHPNFSSLPSTEDQISQMLQEPLVSMPGEVLRYSNLGTGIVARAAEVLAGASYQSLIQHAVLNPMGLDDIILCPGDHYNDRIATLKDPANPGTQYESYNSHWWRTGAIPWGGYYGTIGDMMQFITSFLPGGRTVLSDAAVLAMTTDQTDGAPGGVTSMRASWDPGFWGCGWEVKGTKTNHWTGKLTSPDTFLHWGFAGTLAWADPDRELAACVFANRSVTSLWSLKPPRWPELCDALCAEADRQ